MVTITGTQTVTEVLSSDDETVLLARNAVLAVEGIGIDGSTTGGHEIIVSGGITTSGHGIVLGDASGSFRSNGVTIGEFGSVDVSSREHFEGPTSYSYAIWMTGDDDKVVNNGSITGGYGVRLEGQVGEVTNNGLIGASHTGIYSTSSNFRLSNAGSISGREYALDLENSAEIVNSGDLLSARDTIRLTNDDPDEVFGGYSLNIENSGKIDGFQAITTNANLDVYNTGEISSDAALAGRGYVFIENSGNLSAGAYNTGSFGYTVVSNTGHMTASTVILNDGSGTDVYGFGEFARISNSGTIDASALLGLVGDHDVELSNTGLITSELGFRESGSFDDIPRSLRMSNTGSIAVTNFEKNAFAANNFFLFNSGDILMVDGDDADTKDNGLVNLSGEGRFRNEGTIISDGTAIADLSESVSNIRNSGLISGDYAIAVFGAASKIYNSGEMSGQFSSIDVSANQATVINHGIINGTDDDGVEISNQSDARIVNTGEISGARYGIDGAFSSGSHVVINRGIIATSTEASIYLHNSLSFSGLTVTEVATYGHTVKNSGDLLGDVDLSAGDDTLINSGRIDGDVLLNSGDNTYDGRGGFVSGSITSGEGADTITGGEVADVISAGDGDNTIRSLGGDDVITTGGGADFIVAGFGDDEIISGQGDDTIRGGDGEDDINGQGGVDFIQGGGGNDYIRMGNGDGQRGEGNAGDDYIAGGNQKDVLLGGADEDELLGQGGNDVLRGGTGDDVLEGGTGDDRIIGNAGEDTAVFSGALADYTFTLNGNGTVDVEDTVGTDGTDNLFGVELVEFTDGTYLLSDFI